MSASNRVAELRTKAGLSQQELAYEAGISIGALSRIENGRGKPNRSTRAAIALALGYRIDTLFPAAPRKKAAAR